jgi:hypothetical protein
VCRETATNISYRRRQHWVTTGYIYIEQLISPRFERDTVVWTELILLSMASTKRKYCNGNSLEIERGANIILDSLFLLENHVQGFMLQEIERDAKWTKLHPLKAQEREIYVTSVR